MSRPVEKENGIKPGAQMADPVEKENNAKPDTRLAATAAELGVDSTHVAELKGADGALQYASEQVLEVDDATNKRILRKIDLHVLPWLCGLYILQFLDKGVLSYAGVMGLQADTHTSTSQYTWLGSIYYVGYMAAVPIHNRLMQRFTPSKYIATCMTLWGCVLASMAACNDWPGLMVQRTFLGSLEASVNCGFTLITAAWYRKYEHAGRVGIWSACVGLSGMLGGIIAFGCVSGYEERPNAYFTTWKILALCTGLLSVVYGVSMFFFMAGSVVSAKWFSDAERTLAVERLRDNHAGIGTRQYKRYQVKEAWLDHRTWLYVLYVLTSQIPAAGLTLLSSILIKSLGFDTKTTLLLALPGGLVNIIANSGFGFLADKMRLRSFAAILAVILSLFGLGLFVGLGDVAPLYKRYGQLVGYYIMSGTSATGFYIVLSMMSSNVLGHTKKTSSNAIVFTAQGLAYFVGPQIFKDAPYYHKAKNATIGLWVLSLVILGLLWSCNWRDNRKRDQLAEGRGGEEAGPGMNIEFMDLTDKENKLFRYVL